MSTYKAMPGFKKKWLGLTWKYSCCTGASQGTSYGTAAWRGIPKAC